MLEQMLDEALTEYYERALSNVDTTEHRFSRCHERVMKRIFKRYEISAARLCPERKMQPQKITCKNIGKQLLAALILIFLGLITGFTAA
ncbi:MAG: hypothetical protein NC401_15835 [Ruminococcus sp.]|nr:hypothetical protein [Ruminococcus sp.]